VINDVSSSVGHINKGIELSDEGDKEGARHHFAQAILKNPESELGWLWFADSTGNPGEQRYCLDRALKINPDTSGSQHRSRLLAVDPVIPPEFMDVHQPPLPPPYRHADKSPFQKIKPAIPARTSTRQITPPSGAGRRGRGVTWVWIALVALITVGMLWAFFVQPDAREEIRHIALVAPLTGPDAAVGLDVRDGAQLAVDQLNERTPGVTIEMTVFDDEGDPEKAAAIARDIVDDARFLAVVGHSSSATTLAAAPIYAAAGLPVISGQATANELDQLEGFFRITTTDSVEGTLLATYANTVLGFTRANVIVGTGVYEREVAQAFNDQFSGSGEVSQVWEVSPDNRDQSIAHIVDRLRSAPQDSITLVSLTRTDAHDVLLQIRRAGLSPSLLGVDSMGSSKFAADFANEPEEQDTPGFFTEGLYASSPLIFDSAIGDALAFARAFTAETGRAAGWRGANAYDAVVMVHTAIQNSDVSDDETDTTVLRQAMLESLRSINSLENALRGVSGPLYFDANGNVPRAFAIGIFRDATLTSAPVQYHLVPNPGQEGIEEDISNGIAFSHDDQVYRQYRVAYVGVEMIELRDLDTATQTYIADFFVYLRYEGDDAPTNLVFTNSLNPDLSVGEPIAESVDLSGLNYRLYRVSGTFSEPMRFEDYPWDKHTLTIRFQNEFLEQTDLVYAADLYAIHTPQEERLVSGFDGSERFNRVPSWNVNLVEFAQFAITSTSDDYDTEGLVQYSEFRTLVHIEREVGSFLIKNLLPLLLLSIATYVFLWFPANQAEIRVGASITALLTSAVMLNSVSSQLPEIGYTVAIEWGFYVYFAISTLMLLLNVAVERNFKAKRYRRVQRLDMLIRTMFPVTVLLTIVGYWIKYM